jgi:hypothetical protein
MGAVTNSEMEPQRRRRIDSLLRTQRHTRTLGPEEHHSHSGRPVGWAECREKKGLLTRNNFRFARHLPTISPLRGCECKRLIASIDCFSQEDGYSAEDRLRAIATSHAPPRLIAVVLPSAPTQQTVGQNVGGRVRSQFSSRIDMCRAPDRQC